MCGSVFIFLVIGEKSVSLVLGHYVGFGIQSCHSLRLSKLAYGGLEAHSEAKLMIIEKIDAAVEASCSLLKNGDVSAVVARYREHVSANADRLSLR
jgi:hypothetical protein